MQTFRAYLQDHTGALTWAAWIDAAHYSEAVQKARDLCGLAVPTVEVWSATDRRPSPDCILDPI
jgi:hypothetical protein